MTRPGFLSNMMRQGKGPRPRRSSQRRGPLRKIARTIRHAEHLFEQSYVELECGHRTWSNGDFRARCSECGEMPRVEAR
jgi:formylmethanofuran dehydrogenase subunit E